jgi:hypothetical protein
MFRDRRGPSNILALRRNNVTGKRFPDLFRARHLNPSEEATAVSLRSSLLVECNPNLGRTESQGGDQWAAVLRLSNQ